MDREVYLANGRCPSNPDVTTILAPFTADQLQSVTAHLVGDDNAAPKVEHGTQKFEVPLTFDRSKVIRSVRFDARDVDRLGPMGKATIAKVQAKQGPLQQIVNEAHYPHHSYCTFGGRASAFLSHFLADLERVPANKEVFQKHFEDYTEDQFSSLHKTDTAVDHDLGASISDLMGFSATSTSVFGTKILATTLLARDRMIRNWHTGVKVIAPQADDDADAQLTAGVTVERKEAAVTAAKYAASTSGAGRGYSSGRSQLRNGRAPSEHNRSTRGRNGRRHGNRGPSSSATHQRRDFMDNRSQHHQHQGWAGQQYHRPPPQPQQSQPPYQAPQPFQNSGRGRGGRGQSRGRGRGGRH